MVWNFSLGTSFILAKTVKTQQDHKHYAYMDHNTLLNISDLMQQLLKVV